MKESEAKIQPWFINSKEFAHLLGLSQSHFYAIQRKLPVKKVKVGCLKLWDLRKIREAFSDLEEVD